MISVERFKPEDESEIRAFNARINTNDGGFSFPAHPRELSTPSTPGASTWTEIWVAKDATAVRGGFLLKRERLLVGRKEVQVANFQLPLSEGIVDRHFAMVGLKLIECAMAAHPALYSLGMGSMTRPLPRLLERRGWRVEQIPFFFRVIRGARFAQHIRALQTSPMRRALLRTARLSGGAAAGAAAWRSASAAVAIGRRLTRPLALVPVARFDERVDRILDRCLPSYAALLDRSSGALNIKFPTTDPRLLRFMVNVSDQSVGWLVLAATELRAHKQFGDLRLGSIVDGLMHPSLLMTAIGLAAHKLTAAGNDLLISNQSHHAWQKALTRNLFARGTTNFILARSPAFAPDLALSDLHINRGDGDGPINL